MPDAPGLELIAQGIGDAHPDAVLGTYHERDEACLIVDPEQILAVLTWLRETPGQQYDFLCSIHGVDYLPAEPRFGVHYELINRERVERIRVRAAIPDVPPASSASRPGAAGSAEGRAPEPGLPSIDSCVEMYPTADLQEREVYDFFGIVFRGHPDLRRVLMPEGYVGWPQRRDFPIGGEPVIFTYNERIVPGWSQ